MAVARWLETDTNSNKDISTAVSIGAYTADADRMIVVDVSLDQVAGNGDYVIYVTRQINGAGSAYVMLPKTTCAAANGETAIAMQSGPITVRSGDVLAVMVDGLAGDTATPDTTVRFFEMAALRPTTADRLLDVSAGGEAGVDWANVGSPTTSVSLSGTTVGTTTALGTDAISAAALSAAAVDEIIDEVIEGSTTMRQLLRGFAAVLLGKSTNSGADYRDLADSKTRVDTVLDDDGNRTAVTLDLT